MYRGSHYKFLAALLGLSVAAMAHPQATSSSLGVKAIAEVEQRSTEPGHETPKLVPADKVVPGDRIIYTLEVHNTSTTTVRAPTIVYPVPPHMWYLADSAVGPGAEVTYSIDGGASFDAPENLRVSGSDGQWRVAAATDYTHICWHLRKTLKANSVAFVRFRVIVRQ